MQLYKPFKAPIDIKIALYIIDKQYVISTNCHHILYYNYGYIRLCSYTCTQ